MNTLFLTTAEKALFDALPKAISEGWAVAPETQAYEDTEKAFRIRLHLLHLQSPALKAFRDRAQKAKDLDEFKAMAQDVDMSEVSPGDMIQLFYALGPGGVTALIVGGLNAAKKDEDVQQIADLAELRHELLDSFIKAAASVK